MSFLTRLEITSVRNIEEIKLDLNSRLNIIYGINGSGKTSILEAAHLLAVGRSFRTAKTSTLISEAKTGLTVFAETSHQSRIGLTKTNREKHKLKLDSELQGNWDSVARKLPVQVLDSKSFLLLEGGPKARRMFLDWGVFHVKHSFLRDWRSTKKCVASRNILLKGSQLDVSQLEVWEAEFCSSAAKVHAARQEYFQKFEPVFRRVYTSLVDDVADPIFLEYWRGWPEGESLSALLSAERERDRRYGATQNGPHRADILVKAGDRNAIDVLSRGQQKVLVCALKIAQGILHETVVDDKCIYLVDDLPSELDLKNRASILEVMYKLRCQLLVTCVDLSSIQNCLNHAAEKRTFHVERGTITS